MNERPEHERITYLTGDPAAEASAAQVRDLTGPDPKALVILGASTGQEVMAAFQSLSPLVPIGSYVVFEDTVLDGHSGLARVRDAGRCLRRRESRPWANSSSIRLASGTG